MKNQKFMEKLSRMKIPTRRRAGIIKVLEEFDLIHKNEPGRNIPLDLHLRYFFLNNKNVFDNESRTQIVDVVYILQRYKAYLNAIS